jgi:hypothetical protein
MKNGLKTPTAMSQRQNKKPLLAIAFALIVVSIILGINEVYRYNAAADQANLNKDRDLILLAVRGVKKDAPVDPKTGDIYFPESHLYLPNPRQALTLTYLFDTGNVADSQSELSVSTYPVRSTEKLYIAQNTKQLFDAVPKLQACSRGIKLVDHKFPTTDTENELQNTVHVSDGRTIFIYVEKGCPELKDTANLFQNVRTYL